MTGDRDARKPTRWPPEGARLCTAEQRTPERRTADVQKWGRLRAVESGCTEALRPNLFGAQEGEEPSPVPAEAGVASASGGSRFMTRRETPALRKERCKRASEGAWDRRERFLGSTEARWMARQCEPRTECGSPGSGSPPGGGTLSRASPGPGRISGYGARRQGAGPGAGLGR